MWVYAWLVKSHKVSSPFTSVCYYSLHDCDFSKKIIFAFKQGSILHLRKDQGFKPFFPKSNHILQEPI